MLLSRHRWFEGWNHKDKAIVWIRGSGMSEEYASRIRNICTKLDKEGVTDDNIDCDSADFMLRLVYVDGENRRRKQCIAVAVTIR